ncbi:CAP domain-containing protein [Aurantibacter crassamenti]|uniref:CAP domain-containing protein n=1 Tax=Aurantibacter crassamenti TaxID=1837375 RepID=UPI001939A5BB|nr:CAP domain-containing protein [Aurantibacter crassamenti]MBM1105417.1 CAP domain-containing protein [Aurantibacter crassamenti]
MYRNFQSSFYILFLAFVLTSCSKDEETINPPEIETDNVARATAKQLYQDHYIASKTTASDPQWNGDSNHCNAGTLAQNTMSKIFQRVHYYRMAVGLNNTLTENQDQSAKAQEAALMMKSNQQLDHFPPSSWSCYTEAGSEAAGKSNLAMAKNAEAVDLYISEPGSSNGPVGHRRWLLWPRLNSMGVGNSDNSNVLWVVGNSGSAPADAPDFISWPPADYVPSDLIYPRWSFSITGADFSQTTVSMVDEIGNAIAINMEDLNTLYGDPTIVWQPQGISTNISEDTAYVVTLNNVEINGELEDFEYTVILFDPNR